MRVPWILATVVMAGSSSGQEGGPWMLTLRAGPSFGQPWIGSEETRRGGYYAVSLARPEKRLSFRGKEASLGLEGFYMFTKGGTVWGTPGRRMHSYGVLVFGRYRRGVAPGSGPYLDVGWGLVYNSVTTKDLDSRLSSAPFVAVGAEFGRFDVQARFLHMSNGGLAGENQGSNAVQFIAGIKF
jgi:hypothetical protein